MPALSFPTEQDRNTRTLRWEQAGPPRVEVTIGVDLGADPKTIYLRMTINGASGATVPAAATELAQVLAAVIVRATCPSPFALRLSLRGRSGGA